MKKIIKCKCGVGNIRKYCWSCGEEIEGDFFKCVNCGEKTLEGFESSEDQRICGICSDEI